MNGRDKIKYTIKAVIAFLLYFTGILSIYKMICLRKKAVVLMYHRILPNQLREKTFSHEGIIVDMDTFEMQVKYLKRAFNVLTIEEFSGFIEHGKGFDKPVCLITFDDGWKDNYTYAYPILKKHNTPATIYLSTNYINSHKLFWQEKLSRLLFDMNRLGKKEKKYYDSFFDLLSGYGLQNIMKLSSDRLRPSIAEAVGLKKKMKYHEIEQMVEDISANIESLMNDRENYDTFLRWDEVRDMKKDGISFASHCMNHRILTKLTSKEADYEITESKRTIEREIDAEVSSISYPNGEYENSIIELVKMAGYHTAFTTERGFIRRDDDRFSLKRINIHNDVTDNVPMFLSSILGVF